MSIAIGWLGALALAVAPVLLLRRAGAAWKWFGLGILSWVLGVIAKSIITDLFHVTFLERSPIGVQAIVDGVVSALTELGAAAWFLRRATLSLSDALAFGTGIGAFEVLFTLGLGWLEGLDSPTTSLANQINFVDAFFLVERSLALVSHTASCLLVYIALYKRWLLPALVAIVLFSIIDGAASYGIAAQWNWEDSALMSRFLCLVAVVAAVEAVAAWWFARAASLWECD